MEVFTTRLESFTKPRRVKHSTTKRTLTLKWPHPSHFIATPDTLTEAGFFFNPSWDARDNVECYLCGKCLDGWDEQDDPFAIHWDKCNDQCAWAVVRCGIPEDIDRKGNFAFKDPTREPDGNAMKKARLATFKVNDSWPHDRVRGHGAHSTKMAKAGFVFTPQTPGDDTGTCLYCSVSLSGWDEDDNPLEEHQKRVKKSNLPCPFFPEAPAPKQRSKTPASRSTTRPKSRAGSKQPRPTPSDTFSSHSDDDSQPEPAPPRQSKRSRIASAAKEKDTSDALRRSTRSSRAKPPPDVEDNSSGNELRRSTSGRGRNKSLAKAKGKEPIEVIEEADEEDAPRAALPAKQRVKGKENVAQDVKVRKPSRKMKTLRANDTDEESRQPKREHPKKAKVVVDQKDESTSGVDSERDVQPLVKRRNIVRSISSVEEADEEINPKKAPRPANPKRKAPIVEDESVSDQLDDAEGLPHQEKKAAPSKHPHKSRAKPEAIEDSNESSNEEPEKQAKQTTDSPRPFKLSKGKSTATSGAPEAEFSQSSDNEGTTTPLPAPTEKPARVATGKGSTSANATAPHHERSRSQTTSGSSSSKPLPSMGNVKPASGSSQDVLTDVMDVDSDVASAPGAPSHGTRDAKVADVPTPLSDDDAHIDVVDMASPTPPARPARSPQRPTPKYLPREESPATPPPASSSLLSVSSTTSTTRAESHTDAETLVEPLPLPANGAQLTEEERLMTVEEWIRQEIEVHYERLRRDGEMKIKLFKERAEEVRKRIESL